MHYAKKVTHLLILWCGNKDKIVLLNVMLIRVCKKLKDLELFDLVAIFERVNFIFIENLFNKDPWVFACDCLFEISQQISLKVFNIILNRNKRGLWLRHQRFLLNFNCFL